MQRLTPKDFPIGLNEIPNPPKELFVEGELPDEKENIFLTVVGPRKISNYGKEVCRYLISSLIGQPIVIVSGLAIGTDALAHQVAIEAELKTMAIPGSGLDPSVLYPAVNRKLAQQILKSGGCLLSEYEPKTKANTYSFPQRNRIMAGLAKAVLIIEASERSGTLITARLATEYNKDLLVVPGSIFSLNNKGSNRLLHQGATPITSKKDLLEAVGLVGDENKEGIQTINNLSPIETELVSILSISPCSKDLIIEKLNLSAGEAGSLLGILEIKGIIKESVGEFRLVS